MNSDFANQTLLNPVGLIAVIVLGLATVLLPRRWAVVPMIVMACLIAPGQRLVVATLDFDLLRIMVLFGWLRVMLRGEYRGFAFRPIDYALLAWALAGIVTYTLLYGSVAAMVNRLGVAFDAAGMYFVFRCWVRDWRDLDRIVVAFAVISVPVAAAFVYEQVTRHNLFSLLGGVPARTLVRQGRLRAQGAFPHPIMAGCFFAAIMPLLAARWWQGPRARTLSVIGLTAAGIIVLATASSTPVLMVALGVFGAGMYLLRRRLRLICWGAVAMLVMLHLVMKKPVWHLLARVNVVGGSTGWHRYHLVDQAIRRFGEWALLGTKSTEHWGLGLIDVTNQYVLEGVRGGVLTLGLFVLTLVLAFRGLGKRLQLVRRPEHVAMVWALGVALFVHCCAFVAVSYFGQIKLLWYLTLAIIGSLTPLSAPQPARSTCRMTSPPAELQRY